MLRAARDTRRKECDGSGLLSAVYFKITVPSSLQGPQWLTGDAG